MVKQFGLIINKTTTNSHTHTHTQMSQCVLWRYFLQILHRNLLKVVLWCYISQVRMNWMCMSMSIKDQSNNNMTDSEVDTLQVTSSTQGNDQPTVTWWHHDMDMFSAWLAFCEGNSPVTGVNSHCKGQVMQNCDFFSLKKMLNKYGSCSITRASATNIFYCWISRPLSSMGKDSSYLLLLNIEKWLEMQNLLHVWQCGK